mmetsp:Transcript_7850/g.19370  ORF Transcript_7850/g.19370 Transcript_7850/m.19370 type:complete len:204 (-) Transcript_7850:2222-2833(-)
MRHQSALHAVRAHLHAPPDHHLDDQRHRDRHLRSLRLARRLRRVHGPQEPEEARVLRRAGGVDRALRPNPHHQDGGAGRCRRGVHVPEAQGAVAEGRGEAQGGARRGVHPRLPQGRDDRRPVRGDECDGREAAVQEEALRRRRGVHLSGAGRPRVPALHTRCRVRRGERRPILPQVWRGRVGRRHPEALGDVRELQPCGGEGL